MAIWWILGGMAVLLVLLWRTRIRVQAAFISGTLTLDLWIGLIPIHLLPAKEKPPQNAGSASVQPAEDGEKKGKGSALPKIGIGEITSAICALWPPLRQVLAKARASVRVAPLKLSVIVGAAEDPAAGAQWYGLLHCGIWTGMPVLEQLLVIPDPRIHLGIDFDTPQTIIDGTVGVSISVGTLIEMASHIAIPALRWFMSLQKTEKQSSDEEKPSDDACAA